LVSELEKEYTHLFMEKKSINGKHKNPFGRFDPGPDSLILEPYLPPPSPVRESLACP